MLEAPLGGRAQSPKSARKQLLEASETMSAPEYKPLMNVYVVWRPEADAVDADKPHGLELARLIYSTFAREVEKPLKKKTSGCFMP